MKSFFAARNMKVTSAVLVIYRAGSDLIGKAAFLLITVAAARRLSQDAFGVFSLAATAGWIAGIATDFGIQLHLARAIAQTPGRAGGLLREWLPLRIATACVGLAAAAAVVFALPSARAYAAPMLLLIATYIVAGLVEFLHYFYRGLSRTDVESSLTVAQRIATLGLALVVLWARPGLTLLGLAMLVPAAAVLLYSARLAFRLAPAAAPRRDPPGTGGRVPALVEWRRDVLPIGAGIVLSALYFRVDVFLVELWGGTHPVALYNAVFRLVEALRLFPAAVLAVALPILCRARSAKPLIHISVAVGVSGAIGAAVVAALAPWIVTFLYGAPYAAAVPAFRVLLIAFPLMSVNYALTHQLIGWNGHRAYAVICGAAFAFNVALNALLIPSLSIAGAAWSTLWTEVVLSAGCIAALWIRPQRAAIEATVAMEAS